MSGPDGQVLIDRWIVAQIDEATALQELAIAREVAALELAELRGERNL